MIGAPMPLDSQVQAFRTEQRIKAGAPPRPSSSRSRYRTEHLSGYFIECTKRGDFHRTSCHDICVSTSENSPHCSDPACRPSLSFARPHLPSRNHGSRLGCSVVTLWVSVRRSVWGRYSGSVRLPKHKTARAVLPCLANRRRHPADRAGESLGERLKPCVQRWGSPLVLRLGRWFEFARWLDLFPCLTLLFLRSLT